MTNIRGGLFPADPAEFEQLITRALNGPRLPRLTPEERIEGDNFAKRAVDERYAKLSLEQTRIELAQTLSKICYDELVFETNRALGAESTKATYRMDFNNFQRWCVDNGHAALPTCPEIVCVYLLSRANDGIQPQQLSRIVSGIAYIHEFNNYALNPNDVLIRAMQRYLRRCFDEQKEIDEETKSKPKPEPLNANGSGQAH